MHGSAIILDYIFLIPKEELMEDFVSVLLLKFDSVILIVKIFKYPLIYKIVNSLIFNLKLETLKMKLLKIIYSIVILVEYLTKLNFIFQFINN